MAVLAFESALVVIGPVAVSIEAAFRRTIGPREAVFPSDDGCLCCCCCFFFAEPVDWSLAKMPDLRISPPSRVLGPRGALAEDPLLRSTLERRFRRD